MRIPLDKIHKPGLKISGDTSTDWVTAAAKTVRGTPGEPTNDPHEDEGADTASVQLKIRRFEDQVHVSGTLEMQIVCACDRCGSSTTLTISGDLDQLYKSPETEAGTDDYDLVATELEIGWHDGQALDLEAVLTEALALLGPDRVRCDDEGVKRIGEDGPCELPAEALEGGPSRANPFAALKLS